MWLTTLPDIVIDDSHIVRVREYMDRGNWSYTLYRTGKKWRKLRSIQHYLTPQAAEQAARTWLSNQKHLSM